MPVTYAAAVANDRMESVAAYFSNGSIEILTSGDSLLVAWGLAAPAGSVSGNTWTLGLDAATVVATGTGTAAKAQIKTSGGLAHITGLTVGIGGSGADIIMDALDIAAAQSCTLAGASITHVP